MSISAGATKAILFIVGGTAVVLVLDIPIRVIDARFVLPLVGALEWLGWIFLTAGVLLILAAEWALLRVGGATGAPGDPPRRLVARGIYRWVRNPIYIGASAELLGLGLTRASVSYICIMAAFLLFIHWYVVTVEEPRTERRLGASYRRYKESVPRWVPRRPE
jgi:protein-S-isoprenylcysteine O-methyltransferase Ste14